MTSARATSGSTEERGGEGSDSQDQPARLFTLPDGKPALFLLLDFENPNLVERIDEHGGQVTEDEASADVILTRSRDEYKILKDRYSVSRKTHVRMSGFVDRCINANRFVLTPIPGKVEKGIPGRVPGARRTEFTEEDDEHLCHYIAEVLPENGEGGRTGHFIYSDLMRRADQFGQYIWAQRHTKNSWRERYRKHQARLDLRIAEIVEENPPAPDGKGRYRSRRVGKLDDEDAEEFLLDAEAVESPTDDDDDPILAKKASPQPQEEEEEDGEEEEHPAGHQSEDEVSPRDEDSYHEEDEEDAQSARRRTRARPITRGSTRPEVSHRDPPATKRRKAKQQEEVPPNDPDLTLLGPDDEDQEFDIPADPDISPAAKQPHSPFEREPTRVTRRTAPQAQPVVPPAPPSPRRTRARSRLHATNVVPPAPTPTTRRRAAARAKKTTAKSVDDESTKARAMTRGGVHESGSHVSQDEFVAHSDSEEESDDMQEVEANLRVSATSRGGGAQPADTRARSLSADDLQTSKRLRRARGAADRDEDEEEEEEPEDDSDAELFAHVKKLDIRPPPTPAKASRRQKLNDKGEDSESDEDVRPPATRAASRMKAKGKAREIAPRRR